MNKAKVIDVNGNKYEVMDEAARALTTDEFDSTAAYSEGDYCIYDNVLYKFTADKAAGDWDTSVVEATTVGAELSELNSGTLRYKGALSSSDDLDDIQGEGSTGVYGLYADDLPVNTPYTSYDGSLEVEYFDDVDKITLQRVYQYVSGIKEIFVRRCNNSSGEPTWSDWQSVYCRDIESTSVSLSLNNYAITVDLKKNGNVVYATFFGTLSLEAAKTTYTFTGTIPEEYRPVNTGYFNLNLLVAGAFEGQARYQINTNGTVNVVSSTTTYSEYICSICWLA